jgi:hypothetical protein
LCCLFLIFEQRSYCPASISRTSWPPTPAKTNSGTLTCYNIIFRISKILTLTSTVLFETGSLVGIFILNCQHCSWLPCVRIAAKLLSSFSCVNFVFSSKSCYPSRMEGFDDPGVFFSDNFTGEDNQNDSQINLQGVKKKFKEFIRQYHTENFNYKYRCFALFVHIFNTFDANSRRDTLKRNYNLRQFYLEVNIEDVGGFDETLADKLYKQPSEHLVIFEEAAKEVADELTSPRPEGEEVVEDIQIMLTSDALPTNLRNMKVKFDHTRVIIFLFDFLVRYCVKIGENSGNNRERIWYQGQGHQNSDSVSLLPKRDPQSCS